MQKSDLIRLKRTLSSVLLVASVAGLFVCGVGCGQEFMDTSRTLANGKTCPAECELVGSAPPIGFEQWCLKMDEDRNFVKNGHYLSWRPNGMKLTEGHYDAGKKSGLWTKWYENGMRASEISYLNDREEGLATFWHQEGIKEAEGKYKEGKKEGIWRQWEKNGQLQSEGTYIAGQEEGVWKESLNYPTAFYSGQYRNGKREGEWIGVSRDGVRLVSGVYEDGEKTGKWTEWYESGNKKSEVEYQKGKMTDIYTEWSDNAEASIVATGTYVIVPSGLYAKSKKTGWWKEEIWNAPESYEEGEYLDGQREGRWARFRYGEVVATGEYKEGKKEGPWIERSSYESTHSKLLTVTTLFQDGRETGPCKVKIGDDPERIVGMYENGQKEGFWDEIDDYTMESGRYINGKRNGLWKKTLNSNRLVVEEGNYVHGLREGLW